MKTILALYMLLGAVFSAVAIPLHHCGGTPRNAPVCQPAADTLIGMKGTERAQFDGKIYTYAAAKVRIAPQENLGDSIEVNGQAIPVEEGDYFNGVYQNLLFIDQGESSVRMLKVWDIKAQKIIFQSKYVEEVRLEGGKVMFLQYLENGQHFKPKHPACEKEAEWEKQGLGIGYGQPAAYDTKSKKLLKTGKITCYPRS